MRVAVYLILSVAMAIMAVALPNHTVSTQSVRIGDVFTYQLRVPLNTGPIDLPEISVFDVMNIQYFSTPTSDVLEMTLQVFDLNASQIPTVSIQLNNQLFTLPAIPIQRLSSISSSMESPHDIAPLLRLKTMPWVWIIGTIVILIIMVMVWLWKRQKMTAIDEPLQVPQIPPVQVAEAALRALLESPPNSPDEIKFGYFKLTEIICRFLTDQFNINATDATTAELKRLLVGNQDISASNRANMITLCETIDQYKFYDRAPMDPSHLIQMIQSIQLVIRDLDDH